MWSAAQSLAVYFERRMARVLPFGIVKRSSPGPVRLPPRASG